MGILLLVIIVLGLLVITARVWKGYESELRRNSRTPATTELVDSLLFAETDDSGSSQHTSTSHSSNHPDPGCAHSHHAADCDFGGHGGFDGGHGGFDGGGHH